MAKLTILDMVQDILNSMDSDEVNSINDTVEALQVAQIIKTTFFEFVSNRNWPHLKSLMQFNGLSDTTHPTHFKLPDDVKEVEALVSVRYNKRTTTDTRDKYERVRYKSIEDFLRTSNGLDSSDATVQTISDFGGATIFIRNDKQPEFWTSFDDEHIVFDSFDKAVETTLQQSKTQLIGYREPSFSLADSFIPDLPSEAFSALLADAKSTAFIEIKQIANEKAEAKAQSQKRFLSRKGWRAQGGLTLPNYGRKRHLGQARRNPLFEKN